MEVLLSRILTILGYAARCELALRHIVLAPLPAIISAPGACRRLRIWLPAVLVVSACATPVPPTEGDRSGGAEPTTAAPGKSERAAPATRAETPQGESAGPDRENSVFFALASTAVNDAGREVLLRHAAKLQSDPKLTVTLSGYTDDLGSREYNVALGQKRVERRGAGVACAARACQADPQAHLRL